MDYSVFRPKKAAPAPKPAPTPAPAAAPAAAAPKEDSCGRGGGERMMGDWGGRGGYDHIPSYTGGRGGDGGGYYNYLNHFASDPRIHNIDITYTKHASIFFNDFNRHDASYYNSRPRSPPRPPRRRYDRDDFYYGCGPPAPYSPFRSNSYMLPAPPHPSPSRYYGEYEPHYGPPPPPPPPPCYPSYFY